MTTQPLDVIYNPMVFEKVSEFFSQGSATRTQARLIERQLREVARVRYEELKNQTKAGLVHTLDSMMEGDMVRIGNNYIAVQAFLLERSSPKNLELNNVTL